MKRPNRSQEENTNTTSSDPPPLPPPPLPPLQSWLSPAPSPKNKNTRLRPQFVGSKAPRQARGQRLAVPQQRQGRPAPQQAPRQRQHRPGGLEACTEGAPIHRGTGEELERGNGLVQMDSKSPRMSSFRAQVKLRFSWEWETTAINNPFCDYMGNSWAIPMTTL